jgi:transcriptional regulator with XRE-family HTH domain
MDQAVEPWEKLSTRPRVSQGRFELELARRGLTGSDFARAAGLSAATVSHIRRGRRVNTSTLRKIVGALVRIPTMAGSEELLEA